MSAVHTFVSAFGRWKCRLCADCGRRCMMPAAEVICRRCEPGGGPRSYRLPGLLERRILQDLSPEELALAAGVSAATVRRAECGRRVRSEMAARLAEALGVSVRALAESGMDESRNRVEARSAGGGLLALTRQAGRGGEKGC